MLVRISDIGTDGLFVNDTISLQALNERMNQAEGNDIEFIEEPTFEVKITARVDGAETEGKVVTRYRQPCAFCMRVLDRTLEVPLNIILKPRKATTKDDELTEDDFIDDVGIVYYDGEHIELEVIIQEALILELTPFLQPERDCEGKCVECGIDPRKLYNAEEESEPAAPVESRMGQLLRKAGLKK